LIGLALMDAGDFLGQGGPYFSMAGDVKLLARRTGDLKAFEKHIRDPWIFEWEHERGGARGDGGLTFIQT
jgi:hypothetical protein